MKDNFSKGRHGSVEKPHILVACDGEQSRNSVRALLEEAGFRVTVCGNGAEAVGLACRRKFDVIVTELCIGVIEGAEAAKIIRSHGANQETCIIALVASEAKEVKTKRLGAEFNDYLEKPIDNQLLINKVEGFVAEAEHVKAASENSEIICRIAADPNYQKKIEKLVSELPNRIEKMRQAFDSNNLKELEFQTQALKKLGSLAELPACAEKATDIEEMIHSKQIEKINERLDELVRLCVKSKLTRH